MACSYFFNLPYLKAFKMLGVPQKYKEGSIGLTFKGFPRPTVQGQFNSPSHQRGVRGREEKWPEVDNFLVDWRMIKPQLPKK